MRGLLGIALILAACGGPSWQEVVDDYALAICQLGFDCDRVNDLAVCIEGVKADLVLTRDAFTSEQEEACMKCMDVVTDVSNGSTCDAADSEDPRVYAACDLDPAVDSDGDSIPDNDDEQACKRPE